MRSSTAVLTAKGRSLATSGFKIIFPVTSMKSRAMPEASPAFRVLGKRRSRTDNTIQISPASPREETLD